MKKVVPAMLGLSLVSVPPTTRGLWGERATLVEPDTIVGSPVRNTEGEDIGKIKQLLIDPEDGEIAYAVVARSDAFGRDEETVVIPWDAFEVTGDEDKKIVFTLDMTVFEIDELEEISITTRSSFASRRQSNAIILHFIADFMPLQKPGTGACQAPALRKSVASRTFCGWHLRCKEYYPRAIREGSLS